MARLQRLRLLAGSADAEAVQSAAPGALPADSQRRQQQRVHAIPTLVGAAVYIAVTLLEAAAKR